jgi:hypothetical protein
MKWANIIQLQSKIAVGRIIDKDKDFETGTVPFCRNPVRNFVPLMPLIHNYVLAMYFCNLSATAASSGHQHLYGNSVRRYCGPPGCCPQRREQNSRCYAETKSENHMCIFSDFRNESIARSFLPQRPVTVSHISM